MRTPLKTLISNISRHSSSVRSTKLLRVFTAPRLLTRMSTEGTVRFTFSAPSAVARSPGAGETVAPGSAAVPPAMRAGLRQSCRDREADAGGRPRDQGGLSRKIEIHAQFRGGE